MKSNLLVNSESYHISKVAWLQHNNLLIFLIPGNNVERVLDKLRKMKKMVSAANNDATEEIINVWSFMIMPWALSVNIKWQKKEDKSIYVFFIDIIWDSPGLLFPGFKGVTKLGQIISILPRLPAICLAADREEVYMNR